MLWLLFKNEKLFLGVQGKYLEVGYFAAEYYTFIVSGCFVQKSDII